ncbi:MAG TPA: cohesin domain-containing protein, partial [Saprospiraceae bacterium]|nr:cohesin domain-containing protein [Saprospiraceae bacterium]
PIPANVTIEACAQIPNPATVTATDQCPTLGAAATVVRDSVSTKTATGIGQYNYTITRRWTATDAAGNTSTGTQLITVKDTKAPVFSASAPATVTVNTETGSFDCKAVAKYKVSQYVSDCAKGADLRVSSTPAGFSLTDTTETLAVGSHTYIFTAKDTTGNIAHDTVTFVVKDATLPTAVCINGVSAALQASGTVVVTVNQFNNNSYDNCGLLADSMKIQRLTAAGAGIGLPSKTLTFNCADADNVTQHKVKLTVRDVAGNESTCQTYIVIQDNVKPTFVSCPPSKTVQCTDDLTPATQGNPTVTDNCTVNAPTFQDSLKAGSGSFCQVLKRTWSVLDQANNLSTCVQTLSIQDTIKPIFDLKPANATLSCEDPQIAVPTVTAKDNCDNAVAVTLKVDTTNIAAGACGMFSFTQKRTWTATDKCGNSQVHTQTITVTDAKAPQFLGLPDTLTFSSASFPATTNCTVPVEIDMSQYLKDCTADTSLVITHSLTSFAPNGTVIKGSFPVADYKLIVTAKDLCNNIGTDTVTLRVVDNSKPTLVCNNNLVVALGTGSTAKITPTDIDLGSTDNCAISKRILSDSTFDCSDVGDQTITMTATDVNGNTNVCTVVVKVTLGNNPGLVVTTVNGTESYFGAQDGTVSASTSGGSGNYSYQWSANAKNATTNTVANLPAGTYTVTVTDTQTQCKGTATAVVTPGPKVTFKVGQMGGAQNSTIEIPVTVEHFTKIYSFSFSYESVNNLVGTVTGTSATAAGLTAGGTFNSNAAGVTWISNGTPLTLPANTVIFNLKVQLTAAPVGSTSVVRIFDGTPSLEVQQDSAGVAKVTMVTLVDGLATINAGSNDLKIGGDIQTWRIPVKPVPGATVNLTGSLTNTQVTPADGTYLFNVPNGANTIVSATKSTAGNQGITAADLLLIQNHIFGSTFTSPYQWVAANVNNSGGANPITLADYLIIQRVVLGTDQHLMGSPDWKFIPKSYTFPTPPLSAPFPQTIEHNPVTQDFLDDDFVAVRMGDVNGNVTPSMGQQESEDRSGETFRFRIPERAFRSGETFTVPFRASDFTQRQAYQLTIEFDPTVFALEDIQAGVLPNLDDKNFGTARLSEGYLSTVWVGRDPLTLRDDELLFSLSFRALRDGKALAEVLRPGSQVTAAEAYDRDGKTMKVDFEF